MAIDRQKDLFLETSESIPIHPGNDPETPAASPWTTRAGRTDNSSESSSTESVNVSSLDADTAISDTGDESGSEAGSRNGLLRQLLDSVTCLAIAVIVFRGFVLEGYIISTGSMAPGLLGYHKRIACPDCHFEFAYGVAFDSDSTPAPRFVRCPNCGQDTIDSKFVPRNEGDQLLVFKTAYSVRDPRRWEPVVFLNPNDPTQAYVKRAVGLPGESIQIRDGDLYVDDVLQRKPLALQRAVRIPVFDHNFPPGRHDWRPRWRPDGRWKRIDRSFVLDRDSEADDIGWSTVRYIHDAWPVSAELGRRQARMQATQGTIITDRYGYNRAGLIREETEVPDTMLATKVLVSRPGAELMVVLQNRDRQAVCRVDTARLRVDAWVLDASVESVSLSTEPHDSKPFKPEWLGREVELEVSTFDQRLTVAIEGETLIRYDFVATIDEPPPTSNDRLLSSQNRHAARGGVSGLAAGELAESSRSSVESALPSVAGQPDSSTRTTRRHRARRKRQFQADATPTIQLAARGGTIRVGALRLFRDVHYTSSPHQHAVGRPLKLGSDEFFFLGDNSPVSLDSRSWTQPVVQRRLFVGKPVVVHLPSKPGRLRISGHETHIRIPDLSRVRTIR